jgi:hypothetical protein
MAQQFFQSRIGSENIHKRDRVKRRSEEIQDTRPGG